ncbi:MAG: cytochrome b [Rhodospirillaceae bacterium]|nr:cytochrome b [Rhodospirillaceae bacterium]
MTEKFLHYRAPAQILHWLTALVVVCGVTFGVGMLNASPGALQNRLFDLHRSCGALILALTGLRLLWRLYTPPPPLIAGMPAWQERAARITHAALYILLFTVPLVGWAGTSAFGAPIPVFGLFELPMILEKDKAVADVLLPLHGGLALTLCALLLLHIGAALHHHFIRKDNTLRRMLPEL